MFVSLFNRDPRIKFYCLITVESLELILPECSCFISAQGPAILPRFFMDFLCPSRQPSDTVSDRPQILPSSLFANGPATQNVSRSQWPRGLRRRSTAARLLRLWVRIPPGAWMFVCCECCVFSGRGLCDKLITRPEESYRLWCVVVCDLETS